MNPKNLKFLNKFINDFAFIFNVCVEVENGCSTIKPIEGTDGGSYEDVNYVVSLLNGAQGFVLWLERNGLELTKK